MVFFTCNKCNETMKRAKMPQHLQRCQPGNWLGVSCLDCCQVFKAQSYNSHLTCISEDAKYKGGSDASNLSKGQSKMNEWVEMIRDIARKQAAERSATSRIFDSLSKEANLPTAEKKFKNFLFSKYHVMERSANQVWQIVAAERDRARQAAAVNKTKTPNAKITEQPDKSSLNTNEEKKESIDTRTSEIEPSVVDLNTSETPRDSEIPHDNKQENEHHSKKRKRKHENAQQSEEISIVSSTEEYFKKIKCHDELITKTNDNEISTITEHQKKKKRKKEQREKNSVIKSIDEKGEEKTAEEEESKMKEKEAKLELGESEEETVTTKSKKHKKKKNKKKKHIEEHLELQPEQFSLKKQKNGELCHSALDEQ